MSHFNIPNGELVRLHLHSADASAGVVMVAYDYAGAARTLGSTERLVLTDASLITAVGGDCGIIFDDEANIGSTAPGFVVLRGTYVANGGESKALQSPFMAPPGVMPFVYAPAGVVDATCFGTIIRT